MFINQNSQENHTYFMKLALRQAIKNLGNTKDNPSVGCVITKNNTVISAGCTSVFGRPHAEHNAIKDSKTNLKGSSMYVSLEPCSNYGKKTSCTEEIINKKINKVFFSINDPDIRSFNKSIKLFKVKKIRTYKGINSKELINFYRSYIKSKKNLLPYLTSKIAVSKDFYTINKKSRNITNEFSRGRVHLIRSQHDCIITSSRTIIKDNSRLTCRIRGLEKKSPSRIILDNKLRIPLDSDIISESNSFRTIIFYNKYNKNKINLLKRRKIETYQLPLDIKNNLDLQVVLLKAKELGFHRILLESGMTLTNSFLNQDLVDQLCLFVSNKYLQKNGRNNIKKKIRSILKNNNYINEKVNLSGEKLLICNIK